MRLIMIRHGQPDWPSPPLISLFRFERMFADYNDAHLSNKGIKVIDILAKRLPKALILSSDLPRTRETAEIIGCKDGIIEFDPLFRELQPPRITIWFVGKLRVPPVIWLLVRWCCWPFGIGVCSETPRAAWSRVAQATNKILTHFETEETIILVSHGWFMTLLAIHLRWRGLIKRGPFIPKTNYGATTEYFLGTK